MLPCLGAWQKKKVIGKFSFHQKEIMSPKESRKFLGDVVVRLQLLVLEEDQKKLECLMRIKQLQPSSNNRHNRDLLGQRSCTTLGIARVWRHRESHVAQNKKVLQGLFSGLPSICKSLLFAEPGFSVQPTRARGWWWGPRFTLGLWGSPGLPHWPKPCSLSSFCVKRWKRGCPMAQWVQGQEFGGDGKLSSCLSLPEHWLWLREAAKGWKQ